MSSSKKVEELSVAELRVMVYAARRDASAATMAPPRLAELMAERELAVKQAWKTMWSLEKRLAKAEEKL